MAITTEQQSQIEYLAADLKVRQDVITAAEIDRHSKQLEIQAKQAKLEAVRMAKEVLVENARSRPANERDVAAEDIIAFANVLTDYVNN